MEGTHTRPAVDLARTSNRPLLAFVLGLLAVPGSTIAWDLPLGGLWIGLPLGIAAIVVGRGALRASGKSALAIAGIVLAVLAIAQMAVWATLSIVS